MRRTKLFPCPCFPGRECRQADTPGKLTPRWQVHPIAGARSNRQIDSLSGFVDHALRILNIGTRR